MLNVTFQGAPFLFVGESLDEGGPLSTVEDYKAGRVSFAHYYAETGEVKRYREVIGWRADIIVLGPAEPIKMDLADMLLALDNMLGGDPGWFEKPKRAEGR